MGDPEGRGLGTPAATGNGLAERPLPPDVWGRSGYDGGLGVDKWDDRTTSPAAASSGGGQPLEERRRPIERVIEHRLERVAEARVRDELGIR